MRWWGILITILYALVLVLIYSLGMDLLTDGDFSSSDSGYVIWLASAIALPLLCQIALLAVTVDARRKWLRKRRHIAVSIASIAIALGLLTAGVMFALWAVIAGDNAFDFLDNCNWCTEHNVQIIVLITVLPTLVFWGIWTLIFRRYFGKRDDQAMPLFRWLYGGSVLELLIVVPCHVLVRSRGDCSAPILTGYGIATGLAVMLLAFGPGVIYLYLSQMDKYEEPGPD